MLGRVRPQKSFGDEALELHVSSDHFLVKVAGLVDWAAFDAYWPKLYGATGNPSCDPLVCFKMLLLQQWYNLSDPQCEAQCKDRLSFRRFLGLSLTDTIPDETVLVRFRKHDAVLADRLIERAPAKAVYANAAYCNKARREHLRRQGIFPRIRFNPRSGELTMRQRVLNTRWAKVRAKVERVFADWKKRRSLGRCAMWGL